MNAESLRALETLREMFAVCANERRMREADALDMAITALAQAGEGVEPEVPLCDKPSGMWCKECRGCQELGIGMTHCSDPINCGNMEPMAHHDDCPHTKGDTGVEEADRLISRLMSSDPNYQDCSDAAALIRQYAMLTAAPINPNEIDSKLIVPGMVPNKIVDDLLRHIEINTCYHEETYRGGVLWEICHACGARWADDTGGKPEFKWPDCVERARDAMLAAAPPAQGAEPGWGNDYLLDLMGEWDCPLPTGMFNQLAEKLNAKAAPAVVVDEAMVERALNAQPFAASHNEATRVYELIAIRDGTTETVVMRHALAAALKQGVG